MFFGRSQLVGLFFRLYAFFAFAAVKIGGSFLCGLTKRITAKNAKSAEKDLTEFPAEREFWMSMFFGRSQLVGLFFRLYAFFAFSAVKSVVG
jgi:hypothetical protein